MGVAPKVEPAGVGDLKVIRQRLARYEAGEVAHVENVMAQESRGRKHRRLRQAEERLEEETARVEESLRDLRSTERFELEQEAESTIKEESNLEAGLDVSASYGPVSVSAFAKGSTSSSRDEADRNASKYAKELTERSLSRLEERIRRTRATRSLDEVEEVNEHGFEPSEGHNVGIYRWVDKYYRCKVSLYGKRLWYEFVVPRPAAFYVFAQNSHLHDREIPTEPVEPTHPYDSSIPLGPHHITRNNYLILVKRHGAEGVKPPPAEEVVLGKSICREFEAGRVSFALQADLDVPPGYEIAFAASKGSLLQSWSVISVLAGDAGIGYFPEPQEFEMKGYRGKLPTSLLGEGDSDEGSALTFHISATARLTAEAYSQWQLDTFAAVMAAYRKQRLDYEERVAAAEIHAGVRIEGQNPAVNRRLERDELRRACLQMWLGRSEPIASTVAADADGYPEIDLDGALANADTVRFVEEGFEWSNMSYELLPYFWGGRDEWVDELASDSSDPVFESFLKAGAAKVRIPVSLSSTEAILWYQLTGEIWSGGAVPVLSSIDDPNAERYQGYLDELAPYIEAEEEADGTPIPAIADELEIEAGDEDTFLTKVPTDLVWLQQSEHPLPDFEAP